MQTYFRPILLTDPAELAEAQAIAGGWTRAATVEVLRRGARPEIVPIADIPAAVRARLTAARDPLAGLALERPRIMGILNVTPDSFSDGGRHASADAAHARALEMVREGAELLDIGGESTRPGAREVAAEDEIARVLPVIERLAGEGGPGVPISIDTRKSAVASPALAAGARIVNDVSGLRFDPDLAGVAAKAGAPLILMHSIGTPETMQAEAEAAYGDVLLDVYDTLEAAIQRAEAGGVPRARIVVDPGIGFGKTEAQNLALLSRISLFHALGCPILLGVSRKGFVGRVTGVSDASRRGPGSAGIGLWAVSQGVQLLRVHDIEMHAQALAAWCAVTVGMADR